MKKIILIAVLLLSIGQTFAHSGHGCHKDVSEDIPHCYENHIIKNWAICPNASQLRSFTINSLTF